jgi:alpha-tubulin suppressor-like RCC1 family protein
MGDDLPAVDLGGAHAVALAAGAYHTCAVLESGAIACWGDDEYGQLGSSDLVDRGDRAGAPPLTTDFGRRVTALAAGDGHTCAILDGPALICWGLGGAGQLGIGDARPHADPLALTSMSPNGISLDGAVLAVTAGAEHTCAILDGGRLKCWGFDAFGELGLGATDNRGDGPDEMGGMLPDVDLGQGVSVAAAVAGGEHACARLDTGDLKCWGLNRYGELGVGDTLARGAAPGQMGDALPAVVLTGAGTP